MMFALIRFKRAHIALTPELASPLKIREAVTNLFISAYYA